MPGLADLLQPQPLDPAAQAQSDALKHQNFMGQLAMLAGGRHAMPQLGQALMGQAQAGQAQQAQAPLVMLKLALEKQALAKGQGEADQVAQERDPSSKRSLLKLALAKQLGMTVPAGAAGSDVGDPEMAIAERLMQAKREAKSKQPAGPAQIGDYTFSRPLTPEQTTKFSDAATAAATLADTLDKYRAAIVGRGSDEMPESNAYAGDRAAVLNNLYAKLIVAGKNAAQLGAISKSDMDLLEKQFPKMTGLSGATTIGTTALKSIDTFKDSLVSSLEAHAKVLGGSRGGGQGQGGAPAMASLPHKTMNGKTFVKDNGLWFQVD